MRSLPVLLIALALLPLPAASHKCPFELKIKGFPEPHQSKIDAAIAKHVPKDGVCEDNTGQCISFDSAITDGRDTAHFGFKTCATHDAKCDKGETGCAALVFYLENDAGKAVAFGGEVCCCEGELCRPPREPAPTPIKVESFDKFMAGSAAGLSALLPLAAVAALIAGRL